MKTLIEALRYVWIGAAIGTALALVLFLALALAGLHTPLSDLGMRIVIAIGAGLMALLGALWGALALVARAAETAGAVRVREVRR